MIKSNLMKPLLKRCLMSQTKKLQFCKANLHHGNQVIINKQPILEVFFFSQLFKYLIVFTVPIWERVTSRPLKKGVRSYNLCYNISELCNVSVQIKLTTSKMKRGIQYSKLGIQVLNELSNDLRLRILRNRKYQENLKFGWRHVSGPPSRN